MTNVMPLQWGAGLFPNPAFVLIMRVTTEYR